MEYIFNNDRAIYIQLVEKLRIQIVTNELKTGERLPSVRELALIAKVNPNTMQKALMELEQEGLIFTERTNGKYVTDNLSLIEDAKNKMAQEKINNFLKDINSIGITCDEAISYLQRIGGNK